MASPVPRRTDSTNGRPDSTLGELLRIPAASSVGGPVDLSAAVIAEAVRSAVAQASPHDALQGVIDMAVQTGPCDAASITMIGPRKSLDTVAASDDLVKQVDHLQYLTGEGPCLDAAKAFAVLRRYSQHHNIKLSVLAEQLASTGNCRVWTKH